MPPNTQIYAINSFLYLYGGKTPKYSKIMQHGGKQNILEDFTKLMKIKRYAPSSIRSYKNAISLFLDAFPDKNPENISIHEIENFLHHKIKEVRFFRDINRVQVRFYRA